MEKISWNSVAKIIVIILITIGSIFGCFVIWEKVFTPKPIQAIPSDITWITNPQNINAQENYKATYELFDSQFSQLITLFTLFGIVVPIGAYLLQSKSLKEERERMEKSLNEKIKEIEEIRKKAEDSEIAAKKAQTDAEESLATAKKANDQLREEVTKNSNALGYAFAGLGIVFPYVEKIPGINSNTVYNNTQFCNIAALNFFAKIDKKNSCIKLLGKIINTKKQSTSSKIKSNYKLNPDDIKTIQQCLGDKFEEFKTIYNDIYESPID